MWADYLCIEHCRGCRELVPRREGGPFCVCEQCWDEHAEAKTVLEPCAAATSVLVASGTTYSGVLKKMLYRLKYDKDLGVVDDLAPLALAAYQHLIRQVPEASDAALVPVPLHWTRLVTRGYNQAELIAEGVAAGTSIKIDRHLLSRRRSTRAQHGLGKEERRGNLQNAFRVNSWAGPSAPAIILVDDIYTSGATIGAAAAVLAKHGFARIYAITAARATWDKDKGAHAPVNAASTADSV
jgi:ComF family protein